jgi:hypothetical protein
MAEKRVMTDELQRQLAGFIGFSNESKIDFPPQEYLDKDESGKLEIAEDLIGYFPTYTLRGFTKAEKTDYDSIIRETIADKEGVGSKERDDRFKNLARICILGMKNNYDLGLKKNVEYVADPTGGMNAEQFEKIPSGRVQKIIHFISKISLLLPGEKISLK